MKNTKTQQARDEAIGHAGSRRLGGASKVLR